MYTIRQQKMKTTPMSDGKTLLTPASAYTVDEYEDIGEFMAGVVQTAQYRMRGYKYRLMDFEQTHDGDMMVRFDWQKSSPTE